MTEEHKRSFDNFTTRVEGVKVLAPRVKNIHFKIQDGKQMHFHAGQFAQMFIQLPDGKVRRTSYSIASPPRDPSQFDLCVTHVEGGLSSTYLHNLKVGDAIQAMGPLGKFTIPQPLPKDVVFVATGSGIAPFRSMINSLYDKKTDRRVFLVFGNRFEEDILYAEEWEALAKAEKSFQSLLTLSRPADSWKGEKGYVQEKIENFVPDPKSKDFYICGLTKMIEGVSEKLKSLGVPETQIHFERYD